MPLKFTYEPAVNWPVGIDVTFASLSVFLASTPPNKNDPRSENCEVAALVWRESAEDWIRLPISFVGGSVGAGCLSCSRGLWFFDLSF